MKKTIWLILILVFLVGVVGCDEPVKKKPNNRIKIGDLMPTQKDKLPSAINFKILTFQVHANKYAMMSDAFNCLTTSSMRFTNHNSFAANGFAAGLGNEKTWAIVGNNLQRVRAKRSKISTLVVYNDLGDDYLIGNISAETPTSYYTLDGSDVEKRLPPGLLGWRIKAHKIADRRGVAQVKIQGFFKQYYNAMLSRIPDYNNGEILFKPISFAMNMDEGDFILLGAHPKAITHEPSINDENRFLISGTGEVMERTRLVDVFFKTYGNMLLPKVIDVDDSEDKDEDKDDDEDKDKDKKTDKNKPVRLKPGEEQLYEHTKDVPIVEVFLIICEGVEN
jgi:hypothetical protein